MSRIILMAIMPVSLVFMMMHVVYIFYDYKTHTVITDDIVVLIRACRLDRWLWSAEVLAAPAGAVKISADGELKFYGDVLYMRRRRILFHEDTAYEVVQWDGSSALRALDGFVGWVLE